MDTNKISMDSILSILIRSEKMPIVQVYHLISRIFRSIAWLMPICEQKFLLTPSSELGRCAS
ncbi:MAG: hypothetical protein ACQEQO_07850 [Thermodesulfobacteriota bacterium]